MVHANFEDPTVSDKFFTIYGHGGYFYQETGPDAIYKDKFPLYVDAS